MPLDTSIALNANAPKPANPLQTALQVAQFRMVNAQGNALQQQIGANQAVSKAIQANTDANGNTDWGAVKGSLASDPAGAYNLPQLNKSLLDNQQAQATLTGTQLDQSIKAQSTLRQGLGSLLTKQDLSPQDVQNFATTQLQAGAITPQVYQAEIQSMPQDPTQLRSWLYGHFQSALSGEQQLANMKPSFNTVNTGPATVAVNQNPNAIGSNGQPMPVGSVGYTLQNGLSPAEASTPTPAFINGQPGNIPRAQFAAGGDQPPPIPTLAQPPGMPTSNGAAAPMPSGPAPGAGQPATPARAPSGFVPTGPAMGVQGSNDGNVQTVNTHWNQLSSDAANAQTNIGIAQNIKAYADKALTGKQGDKLAAVNGILSILGVGGQTDLNTATDLLNKNMARLSLTSRAAAGGTDAAGALATAANPHGSMTSAAIKDAADQVIGAQQMALAEQKVLQPYKLGNDVAGYQKAQTQFNQAADPRVWQFANMSPQQRATFKSSMSPADQQAFSAKIRTLESLGAIQ